MSVACAKKSVPVPENPKLRLTNFLASVSDFRARAWARFFEKRSSLQFCWGYDTLHLS